MHQDQGLTKEDIANGGSQQMPFTGEVLDMENIITETNGKQKIERCACICLKRKSVIDALQKHEL